MSRYEVRGLSGPRLSNYRFSSSLIAARASPHPAAVCYLGGSCPGSISAISAFAGQIGLERTSLNSSLDHLETSGDILPFRTTFCVVSLDLMCCSRFEVPKTTCPVGQLGQTSAKIPELGKTMQRLFCVSLYVTLY
jgi:hypothetical protein